VDTQRIRTVVSDQNTRVRPSAHMQFLVERFLADSCPSRRETLRLMGVRTHHYQLKIACVR
jgi:hypothetical protein